MTNLEKYKAELCNYVDSPRNQGKHLEYLITDFMDTKGVNFEEYCGTDNMMALWWLIEEATNKENIIQSLKKLSAQADSLGTDIFDLSHQSLNDITHGLETLSNDAYDISSEISDALEELEKL